MKVNGIDIASYGAKQFRVEMGHHDQKGDREWLIGAALPYFGPVRIGFRAFTVTVNLFGHSRSEIIRARSDLLSLFCQGAAELELKGFENKFRAALTGHKETEITQWRWHQLQLEFEGYEHGALVTAQEAGEQIIVNNPGNLTSPCIVEITPTFGAPSITLSGICRDSVTGEDLPVTITDLETDHTVILDGIAGLITQDGELKEIEAWQLPTLRPGENIITCDNDRMILTVKVMPMYM